ncbi:nucleotidyltransferase family protein [Lutimaribacter pacificus]|nr:nucleotidyltransferase family protein [Lutimaribacter pacificus]
MTTAILILAAGRSSRMGGADKMQESVDGAPLLAVMAARALATGLPVWVTVPALSHPRARVLPKGVTPVPVADADEGMAASIRAGVAALPGDVAAVMILPADLPDLSTQDLRLMADTYRGGILRATAQDGTPGHPVIFPRTLFAELQRLSGDEGARGVLRAHAGILHLLALPAAHATTDLDTPGAWAAWRAARG